jgi:sortase A
MIAYQPRPSTTNSDALELLQALLADPLAPSSQLLHRLAAEDPLALLQTLLTTPIETLEAPQMVSWSQAPQRSARRRSRLRAIRRDRILQGAQWLLIAASLVAFGYWTVEVPVRNWLHNKPALPRATLSLAQLPARNAASDRDWAPRAASTPLLGSDDTPHAPATGDPVAQAPVEDYFAPRQIPPEQLVANLPPQPTHLLIPSIKLDTPVVETFVNNEWQWEVAQYAAGYLHGTGLPGDPTNMVMAGHAGFFGGVFANLGSLVAGDDIFVDAAGWRYRYRVRETRIIWPNQIEVMDSTPTAVLTLITCTNWDIQRLVVIADLIESRPL